MAHVEPLAFGVLLRQHRVEAELTQEVTLHLRNRGFLVATGRCYEPQQAVPFYPFLEALDTVYAAAPSSIRNEAPRRWPYLARPRRSAELAWHFLEGDEPERALPYATLAGDQAESVFAHREVEQHYRVALELAQNSGDTSPEAELLEKLGGVLKSIGRYDDALGMLEQAADMYRKLHDVEAQTRVTA